MKLIGKLKEKVDQAESLEVKKGLIEEAGVALTDDELEKVAGGEEEYIPGTDDDGPVQILQKPYGVPSS